jgi:hypothetical protein
VRRVKRLQHLNIVEGLSTRSACKRLSEDLRVMKNLRKDRVFEFIEGLREELRLKYSNKHCKVARR